MNDKTLLELSISDAEDLIAKKQITPVELLDAYLKRIKDTDDALCYFTDVFEESAKQTAQGLTSMQDAGHLLGPLHGIPIAIKDNIDLKGRRTAAGSKIRNSHIAASDATVTERLKSAGAIILGHVNMHEFAWGATTDNPHFGASRNPWNPERFCAGSSGGSGGAVANGSALGALGTDTGGSVRLPSAINGIVGMRPTIGRVPNRGIVPCGWTMDTCGPMTRTVKDNAIMLNVMAGHDYRDPGTAKECTSDYCGDLQLGIKNMRIGIIPQIMHKSDQTDVAKSLDDAIRVLESLGVQIVECVFDNIDYTKTAWNIINSAEDTAYHQKEIRAQPENYGEDVRVLLAAGEFLPASFYLQAQRFRQIFMDEFRGVFKNVDAVILPTIPFTALKLGNYELVVNGEQKDYLEFTTLYTAIASLTGYPALSVPCGLDHEGLPIGLQIVGKPFDEVTVYRIGAAFEQICNLHKQLPAVR